ncbi:hypothetical protein TCAL_07566 [Tigriopus californicus]|uniref:Glycine N-acyltransferase-like protein n=1 Tax=Tigriopus californicus TaxID=6832 RepID=A0A553PM37_TIGCA|nr:uncharacterized protein LOC131889974 [Tigriopus californicus]TRY78740.1 hypothetical protein TCAL_07566 [Tigriopus californicus]|eukprot:TCALIF_07566-PA protein Name:"Protein of unknown function" AED:0.00 eAED:0.00 QI:158/1/1/1/0.66/0.75/4/47/271
MKEVTDLEALRDTLAKELPYSIQAVESVKHQLIFKYNPAKTCFVSEDSSLVVIKEVSVDDLPLFTIYCNEKDVSKIESDLRGILSWKDPWAIGCVPNYMVPVLKKIALSHGPETNLEVNDCWVVILDPKVKLPEIELKPNWEVKQIPPSDATFVNKMWRYRSDSSLDLIKAQTNLGLGFGTYVDGELASSTVTFNFGLLGAVATAEHHRRKGLAQITLAFGSNYLRSLGLNPFGYVETYNSPSLSMIKKVGYTHTHDGPWMFWKRPKPTDK